MFVTGSLAHGGAERQSITLMNRLAQRGHECHLVHIKRAGTEQAGRIRVRNGGGVYCLDAVRYFDRHALAAFAGHIARIKPSVIVAANGYALMYSTLALRLARSRIPLAVTFHSMRLLDARERLQMLAYRLFFWLADCTVFVCKRQRRHWLWRALGSRKVEVIYNGVDTEAFHDRTDPAERGKLRGELGFSSTDYVIGICARLSPDKNHVQLVDAVAALRGMGIPARVLMVGGGDTCQAIESRALALGVGRDVVITGFQEDVRPYVAACDTMVLCSHSEAFSLAAIEAMAMGKPFVHSRVGGAGEMIRPGENGWLFPVGDTAALVDCLARLADAAVREPMGRRARANVEALFSETAMVDRYEQLLAGLCRASPRRGGAGVPLKVSARRGKT